MAYGSPFTRYLYIYIYNSLEVFSHSRQLLLLFFLTVSGNCPLTTGNCTVFCCAQVSEGGSRRVRNTNDTPLTPELLQVPLYVSWKLQVMAWQYQSSKYSSVALASQ